MANNYWAQQVSRRRVVAGAAGFAVAGIVGCGGKSESQTSPTTGTTASTSPTTTTKDAPIVGGTARFPFFGLNSGDPPTLNPFENLNYLSQVASGYHYSLLVRDIAGKGIDPSDYTKLEGDACKDWEQPDDTTYVFHWRPNLIWHDKAPLNGRAATAKDFVNTYEAFQSTSQSAASYSTVIDTITAPDDLTLKIKLKLPFAPFLVTYASSPRGIWFIPVESIAGGQVETDPVGTGPFVFKRWDKGVSLDWDRNPSFYANPAPYFEKVKASLSGDPQRIIASLKSGDLDFSGLSGTVYELAKSSLDPAGQSYGEIPANNTGFLFDFDADGGRWRDKRLRQALSMAMDRKGYLEILDPTKKGAWNAHISAYLRPFWISPETSQFGSNYKNYSFNPSEAKKLLQAATGSDAITFRINANIDRYGAAYQQMWEVMANQLKQVGFNAELNYQPYSSYIQTTYLGKIDAGIGLGPYGTSSRDPDELFFGQYASVSERKNWGGTPILEMADIDARFDKQRTILKLDDRIAYLQELDNIMADSFLMVPGVAPATYGYANPWVQNYYSKNGYEVPRATVAHASFTQARISKGP